MFGEALGAIGGGAGLTAGAGFMLGGSLGLQAATSAYNAYQQHQQYEYQKDIQKQIFQREDNSIQRRVADLQAAGLSPVLAAGQGAGAGSVVSTTAPQVDDVAGKYMNLIKMQNDIALTSSQKDLMDAQKKSAIQSANVNFQEYKKKQGDQKVFDAWNRIGVPSTGTGDLQKAGFIESIMRKFMEKTDPDSVPNAGQTIHDWKQNPSRNKERKRDDQIRGKSVSTSIKG